MSPDMECTLWPDGWPQWLGGTGSEWLHCCIAHDLGSTDWQLAQCVASSGWPFMAGIMLAGLSTFGVIYRAARRPTK